MKVLFSGGGTLGPVTPLLALHEILREKDSHISFVWVGTKSGPERRLLENTDMEYRVIVESKLRRYFSFVIFKDFLYFFVALFQAWKILRQEKPGLCISAGAYVSVPVHVAAYFLGIPTWVHQQDVRVGLANRIMSQWARVITVTLEKSKHDFGSKNVVWLGNPIRKSIVEGKRMKSIKDFGYNPEKPVILATGGGTGAERLNQMIVEAAQNLGTEYQWIHLTGESRKTFAPTVALTNYHAIPFLAQGMNDLYAAADIVISRGGFGTLSELAALQKPVIVIPKPGHQEENVAWFESRGAVLCVTQNLAPEILSQAIKNLYQKKESAQALGVRLGELLPRAKTENILKIFAQFQIK